MSLRLEIDGVYTKVLKEAFKNFKKDLSTVYGTLQDKGKSFDKINKSLSTTGRSFQDAEKIVEDFEKSIDDLGGRDKTVKEMGDNLKDFLKFSNFEQAAETIKGIKKHLSKIVDPKELEDQSAELNNFSEKLDVISSAVDGLRNATKAGIGSVIPPAKEIDDTVNSLKSLQKFWNMLVDDTQTGAEKWESFINLLTHSDISSILAKDEKEFKKFFTNVSQDAEQNAENIIQTWEKLSGTPFKKRRKVVTIVDDKESEKIDDLQIELKKLADLMESLSTITDRTEFDTKIEALAKQLAAVQQLDVAENMEEEFNKKTAAVQKFINGLREVSDVAGAAGDFDNYFNAEDVKESWDKIFKAMKTGQGDTIDLLESYVDKYREKIADINNPELFSKSNMEGGTTYEIDIDIENAEVKLMRLKALFDNSSEEFRKSMEEQLGKDVFDSIANYSKDNIGDVLETLEKASIRLNTLQDDLKSDYGKDYSLFAESDQGNIMNILEVLDNIVTQKVRVIENDNDIKESFDDMAKSAVMSSSEMKSAFKDMIDVVKEEIKGLGGGTGDGDSIGDGLVAGLIDSLREMVGDLGSMLEPVIKILTDTFSKDGAETVKVFTASTAGQFDDMTKEIKNSLGSVKDDMKDMAWSMKDTTEAFTDASDYFKEVADQMFVSVGNLATALMTVPEGIGKKVAESMETISDVVESEIEQVENAIEKMDIPELVPDDSAFKKMGYLGLTGQTHPSEKMVEDLPEDWVPSQQVDLKRIDDGEVYIDDIINRLYDKFEAIQEYFDKPLSISRESLNSIEDYLSQAKKIQEGLIDANTTDAEFTDGQAELVMVIGDVVASYDNLNKALDEGNVSNFRKEILELRDSVNSYNSVLDKNEDINTEHNKNLASGLMAITSELNDVLTAWVSASAKLKLEGLDSTDFLKSVQEALGGANADVLEGLHFMSKNMEFVLTSGLGQSLKEQLTETVSESIEEGIEEGISKADISILQRGLGESFDQVVGVISDIKEEISKPIDKQDIKNKLSDTQIADQAESSSKLIEEVREHTKKFNTIIEILEGVKLGIKDVDSSIDEAADSVGSVKKLDDSDEYKRRKKDQKPKQSTQYDPETGLLGKAVIKKRDFKLPFVAAENITIKEEDIEKISYALDQAIIHLSKKVKGVIRENMRYEGIVPGRGNETQYHFTNMKGKPGDAGGTSFFAMEDREKGGYGPSRQAYTKEQLAEFLPDIIGGQAEDEENLRDVIVDAIKKGLEDGFSVVVQNLEFQPEITVKPEITVDTSKSEGGGSGSGEGRKGGGGGRKGGSGDGGRKDSGGDDDDEDEEITTKHLKWVPILYDKFKDSIGDTVQAMNGAKNEVNRLANALVKSAVEIEKTSPNRMGPGGDTPDPSTILDEIDVEQYIKLLNERISLVIHKGMVVPLDDVGDEFLELTKEQGDTLRNSFSDLVTWQKQINKLAASEGAEFAARIEEVAEVAYGKSTLLFGDYVKAAKAADKVAKGAKKNKATIEEVKVRVDSLINKNRTLYEAFWSEFGEIEKNTKGLRYALTSFVNANKLSWDSKAVRNYANELRYTDKALARMIEKAEEMKEQKLIDDDELKKLKNLREYQLGHVTKERVAGNIGTSRETGITVNSNKVLRNFGNLTDDIIDKLGLLNSRFYQNQAAADEFNQAIANLRDTGTKGQLKADLIDYMAIEAGMNKSIDLYIAFEKEARKILKKVGDQEAILATQIAATKDELKERQAELSNMKTAQADPTDISHMEGSINELKNNLASMKEEQETLTDSSNKLGAAEKELTKVFLEKGIVLDEYATKLNKITGHDEKRREILESLSEVYGRNTEYIYDQNAAYTKAQRYISALVVERKKEIKVLTDQAKAQEEIRESFSKGTGGVSVKQDKDAGIALEKLQNQIKELNGEIQDLESTQKLSEVTTEKWHQSLNKAAGSASKFSNSLKGGVGHIDKYNKSMYSMHHMVKRFALWSVATAAVIGLARGIREAVEIITDYDQALHNIQAITEATDTQMRNMSVTIRQIATDTKFSASEIAEGMTLLGQAGLTASESIQVVDDVSMLATGTMTDFADVTDLMTTSLNAFSLEASRAGEVSDIMANAVNESKLTIDKLKTAFNYVGAAGAQLGLSLNEVTGSLMVMADQGVRASTSGTGLRRVLTKLISPNKTLTSAMIDYGFSLGDLDTKTTGYMNVLDNLSTMLWDAKTNTVDMAKAVEFFGVRGAQATAALIKGYKEGDVGIAIQQTRELGAAAKMAAEQQEGLGLKVKNMQDRIKNVVLALGDAGLTSALKAGIDAMRGLSGATADYIATDSGALISQITMMGTAFATAFAIIKGGADKIKKMQEKIAFVPKKGMGVEAEIYNQIQLEKHARKTNAAMYEQTTAWEKFKKSWGKKIKGIGTAVGIGLTIAAVTAAVNHAVTYYDKLYKKMMDVSNAFSEQGNLAKQWASSFIKSINNVDSFDDMNNAVEKMFINLREEGENGKAILQALADKTGRSVEQLERYVASSRNLSEAIARFTELKNTLEEIVDLKFDEKMGALGKALDAATKQSGFTQLGKALGSMFDGVAAGLSDMILRMSDQFKSIGDAVAGLFGGNVREGLPQWTEAQLEVLDAMSSEINAKIKKSKVGIKEGFKVLQDEIDAQAHTMDTPTFERFENEMKARFAKSITNSMSGWNIDAATNKMFASMSTSLENGIDKVANDSVGWLEKIGIGYKNMFGSLGMDSGFNPIGTIERMLEGYQQDIDKIAKEKGIEINKSVKDMMAQAQAAVIESGGGSIDVAKEFANRYNEVLNLTPDDKDFQDYRDYIDEITQSFRGGTEALLKETGHYFTAQQREVAIWNSQWQTTFKDWKKIADDDTAETFIHDSAVAFKKLTGIEKPLDVVKDKMRSTLKEMKKLDEEGKGQTISFKQMVDDIVNFSKTQKAELDAINAEYMEKGDATANLSDYEADIAAFLANTEMSADAQKSALEAMVQNYKETHFIAEETTKNLANAVAQSTKDIEDSFRLLKNVGADLSFGLDTGAVLKEFEKIRKEIDLLFTEFKKHGKDFDFLGGDYDANQVYMSAISDAVSAKEKQMAVNKLSGASEIKIVEANIRAYQDYIVSIKAAGEEQKKSGQFKDTKGIDNFTNALVNKTTKAMLEAIETAKKLNAVVIDLDNNFGEAAGTFERFYQARTEAANTARDKEEAILKQSYHEQVELNKDLTTKLTEEKNRSLDGYFNKLKEQRNREFNLETDHNRALTNLAQQRKNDAIRAAEDLAKSKEQLARKTFEEETRGVTSGQDNDAWATAEQKLNERLITSAKAATDAKIAALSTWKDYLFTTYDDIGSITSEYDQHLKNAEQQITDSYDKQINKIVEWRKTLTEEYDAGKRTREDYVKAAGQLDSAMVDAKQGEINSLIEWRDSVKKTHSSALTALQTYANKLRKIHEEIKVIQKQAAKDIEAQNKSHAEYERNFANIGKKDSEVVKSNFNSIKKEAIEMQKKLDAATDPDDIKEYTEALKDLYNKQKEMSNAAREAEVQYQEDMKEYRAATAKERKNMDQPERHGISSGAAKAEADKLHKIVLEGIKKEAAAREELKKAEAAETQKIVDGIKAAADVMIKALDAVGNKILELMSMLNPEEFKVTTDEFGKKTIERIGEIQEALKDMGETADETNKKVEGEDSKKDEPFAKDDNYIRGGENAHKIAKGEDGVWRIVPQVDKEALKETESILDVLDEEKIVKILTTAYGKNTQLFDALTGNKAQLLTIGADVDLTTDKKALETLQKDIERLTAQGHKVLLEPQIKELDKDQLQMILPTGEKLILKPQLSPEEVDKLNKDLPKEQQIIIEPKLKENRTAEEILGIRPDHAVYINPEVRKRLEAGDLVVENPKIPVEVAIKAKQEQIDAEKARIAELLGTDNEIDIKVGLDITAVDGMSNAEKLEALGVEPILVPIDIQPESLEILNNIELTDTSLNVEVTASGSETLPISQKIDSIKTDIKSIGEENPKINFDLSDLSEEELNDWMDKTSIAIFEKANGWAADNEDKGIKPPLGIPTDEEFDEMMTEIFLRLNGWESEEESGIKVPLAEPTDEELEDAVTKIYAKIKDIPIEETNGLYINPIFNLEEFITAFNLFKETLGESQEVIVNFMATGSSKKPFSEKVNDLIAVVKNLIDKLAEANVTVIATIEVDATNALNNVNKVIEKLSKIVSKKVTVNIHTSYTSSGTPSGKAEGGYIDGYAEGGSVNYPRVQGYLPGRSQVDDTPAMLMKGEYVMKQSAVDTYGKNFMDMINSRSLVPKFAQGGVVDWYSSTHSKIIDKYNQYKDYLAAMVPTSNTMTQQSQNAAPAPEEEQTATQAPVEQLNKYSGLENPLMNYEDVRSLGENISSGYDSLIQALGIKTDPVKNSVEKAQTMYDSANAYMSDMKGIIFSNILGASPQAGLGATTGAFDVVQSKVAAMAGSMGSMAIPLAAGGSVEEAMQIESMATSLEESLLELEDEMMNLYRSSQEVKQEFTESVHDLWESVMDSIEGFQENKADDERDRTQSLADAANDALSNTESNKPTAAEASGYPAVGQALKNMQSQMWKYYDKYGWDFYKLAAQRTGSDTGAGLLDEGIQSAYARAIKEWAWQNYIDHESPTHPNTVYLGADRPTPDLSHYDEKIAKKIQILNSGGTDTVADAAYQESIAAANANYQAALEAIPQHDYDKDIARAIERFNVGLSVKGQNVLNEGSSLIYDMMSGARSFGLDIRKVATSALGDTAKERMELASGGWIPGRGHKDDVPALLMKGEYVMKQSAVDKYGQGFMNSVNQGELSVPKYAEGGFIGNDNSLEEESASILEWFENVRHNGLNAYTNMVMSGQGIMNNQLNSDIYEGNVIPDIAAANVRDVMNSFGSHLNEGIDSVFNFMGIANPATSVEQAGNLLDDLSAQYGIDMREALPDFQDVLNYSNSDVEIVRILQAKFAALDNIIETIMTDIVNAETVASTEQINLTGEGEQSEFQKNLGNVITGIREQAALLKEMGFIDIASHISMFADDAEITSLKTKNDMDQSRLDIMSAKNDFMSDSYGDWADTQGDLESVDMDKADAYADYQQDLANKAKAIADAAAEAQAQAVSSGGGTGSIVDYPEPTNYAVGWNERVMLNHADNYELNSSERRDARTSAGKLQTESGVGFLSDSEQKNYAQAVSDWWNVKHSRNIRTGSFREHERIMKEYEDKININKVAIHGTPTSGPGSSESILNSLNTLTGQAWWDALELLDMQSKADMYAGIISPQQRGNYSTTYERLKDQGPPTAANMAEISASQSSADDAAKRSYDLRMSNYDEQKVRYLQGFNMDMRGNTNSLIMDTRGGLMDMFGEMKEGGVDLRRSLTEAANEIVQSFGDTVEDVIDLRSELYDSVKGFGKIEGFSHWLNSGGSVNMVQGAIHGKDSVAAALTPGEYVIQEPVVSKFGKSFFDNLNAGVLQYNQGGMVGYAEGGNVTAVPEQLGTVVFQVGNQKVPMQGQISGAKALVRELKKMGVNIA